MDLTTRPPCGVEGGLLAYLLTYLLTYLLNYLLTYPDTLLTYLLTYLLLPNLPQPPLLPYNWGGRHGTIHIYYGFMTYKL